MFTVPNVQTSPAFATQAYADSTDDQASVLAMGGSYAPTGCAVAAKTTPSMAVKVSAGIVYVNGQPVKVSAVASLTITAATSHDRRDIVTVSKTGTVSVTKGTPCSVATWTATSGVTPPVKPAIPATHTILAEVTVAHATTSIVSGNIIDKRWPNLAMLGTAPLSAAQATPVGYATNTALPNSPAYTNSLGTLTATTTGALKVTPAFVTPPATARVAVCGQSTKKQNGIYVVTSSGGVSSKWKLTRASTMNTSTKAGRVITARVKKTSPLTGSYASGAVLFVPAAPGPTFVLGTTLILAVAATNGVLATSGNVLSGSNVFIAVGGTASIRANGALSSTTQTNFVNGYLVTPKSGGSFVTKTLTGFSTHTIVGGTAWQPNATKDVELHFMVTHAGKITVSRAATSAGTAHVLYTAVSVVAGTSITMRIPAGWYVKVSLTTSATVGVATQQIV